MAQYGSAQSSEHSDVIQETTFSSVCLQALDYTLDVSNYFFSEDPIYAIHCVIEDSTFSHDRFLPMYMLALLSNFSEFLSEYLTIVIGEGVSPEEEPYKAEIFSILSLQTKLYPIFFACMFCACLCF